MATAADLIKSSLRAIGVIASGEAPSAAEQSDALDVLNDILEKWSNDGFLIFEQTIEEFTFTPNTGAYLIGPGAAFDTSRPQIIVGAKFKKAGETFEYPIDVWNIQEWGKISQRALSSGFPEGVYYNPTYPSGTLNFWPVPDAANTVILYSLKPLSAIASASTTLSYPPGYKGALKDQLKIDLAEEFGRPVTQTMVDSAKDSKAGIQRTNTEPLIMESDAFGLNECPAYDIWRPYG